MANIYVREMTIADVPQVHEIELLCFSDPWSISSFENEISGNHACFYLVAEKDGRILGYAGAWLILDEGHITNVAVHPDFRGQGAGDLLVAQLLHRCTEKGINVFTLEVRVSNVPAIHLYRKYGFQVAGLRKNYYGTEDGLILWTNP